MGQSIALSTLRRISKTLLNEVRSNDVQIEQGQVCLIWGAVPGGGIDSRSVSFTLRCLYNQCNNLLRLRCGLAPNSGRLEPRKCYVGCCAGASRKARTVFAVRFRAM